MRDEVRRFIVSSLAEMNYDVTALDDATTLGPAGLDLESLALADLLMRAEERYSITFTEAECKELSLMNVGDLTEAVVDRIGQTAGSRQS
ncbi:MAG TPA: acyl carrier protein [Jatrophihabitans sp.]|jgi:acyl carrier protein|uniref:acyl carrier protein n=1 Tax=Jatrophihabitans sp. TaxID=1932789 RepID=UPI002F14514B